MFYITVVKNSMVRDLTTLSVAVIPLWFMKES